MNERQFRWIWMAGLSIELVGLWMMRLGQYSLSLFFHILVIALIAALVHRTWSNIQTKPRAIRSTLFSLVALVVFPVLATLLVPMVAYGDLLRKGWQAAEVDNK